jgi:sugar-specific transcriptional regulator TrmB/DNA-binding CsgD family transcriptional regulator
VLEAFGVEKETEAVYIALLNQPTAGVREIAELLGLSDGRIHQALAELARLSLVRPSWGDPRIIRPVSPDIGLQYLLAREEAELLQRQNQIESSRAAIAELIAELSVQGGTALSHEADLSQVFGLEAIRTKLIQFAYSTRQQVLSLMPDGAQTSENMEASRPLDEMLLRRGVEILTVYLDSVRNDQGSREYVKWLLDLGGQIRTVAILPLRLLVFDRNIAVIPLNPRQSEVGVAIVQGNGPVAAMCALFDKIWESAAPYGETPSRETGLSLTELEFTVARLLAHGDTDATISRKLGVSPRTAGRIASELMAKVGAKSRFQAGVRIGELGWHRTSPHADNDMAAVADQEPTD